MVIVCGRHGLWPSLLNPGERDGGCGSGGNSLLVVVVMLVVTPLLCSTAAGAESSVLELPRRETARVVDGITDPLCQSHRRSSFTRRTTCWA